MTQRMLSFSKMHGLGNDFMVIDLISQRASLSPKQIRSLADRHTGIGFDQLLLVEAPQNPQADFRYRIFNADGTEVEQCGNGARCFGRFVREQRLTRKKRICAETLAGLIEIHVQEANRVCVDMGAPRFAPAQIPFITESQRPSYPLDVGGQVQEVAVLSMGNPHAVLRVEQVKTARVAQLGARIERHPCFPARVNVGFLQVTGRHTGKLRVWERGVGETRACGTGACAAAVAAIAQGWMDSPVQLTLRGGMLDIAWAGEGQPVLMTGPAVTVYQGQIAS